MDRTPEEWRDVLLLTLSQRRPLFRILRAYYDGVQSRPTAPSTTTDTYRRLQALGVTNMCGLVVDTVNERLRLKGVRLTDNGLDDLEVWKRVWQANDLDADWPTAQEEALKIGRCPLLVWPNDPNDRSAGVAVTVEDADETLVAYSPGSRRVREAALKVFTDGETEFCTVWTPDLVQAWTRPAPEYSIDGSSHLYVGEVGSWVTLVSPQLANAARGDWEADPGNSGTNPLGFVPVVELVCKPSVKGIAAPEISPAVITIQDRINKAMFDTMVASEFGAFPQRYAMGVEVQRDPVTGLPVNPLTVGPNRTWILEQSEGQTASVGQLAPFPLVDLLALIDASIKHLASISQTPVYYLLSGLTNVGADAIRAAETGHVAKIIGHQTRFGATAEEIFRLALIAEGNPSPPVDIEVEWAPPETRSPAELADAALKMSQTGWPFEAISRYLGASPSEIARLMAERSAQTPELAAMAVVRESASTTAPVVDTTTTAVPGS